MREFPRPVVVVSRCLEFDSCRWDGKVVASPAVKALGPFAELIPLCPETAIGLGVPREPIRIVERGGVRRLVLAGTGRDLTDGMASFSREYLGSLVRVDGFVLKGRSPTCGIGDVKIYHSADADSPLSDTGTGFFAREAEALPGLPVTANADRLYDPLYRHHFHTRLFTMASFGSAAREPSIAALERFHSNNKCLLMAYSPSLLERMERLLDDSEGRPAGEVFDAYRTLLGRALENVPRAPDVVNSLSNCIRGRLNPGEKKSFTAALELYRSRRLSQSELTARLYALAEERLIAQTLFNPYPSELSE